MLEQMDCLGETHPETQVLLARREAPETPEWRGLMEPKGHWGPLEGRATPATQEDTVEQGRRARTVKRD